MKNFTLAIVPVTIALLVGCTVSDDKPLADIDTSLWEKICDKATADSVDETYDCDGVEVTVEATTAAECVEGSDGVFVNGDCTFGQWRECQEWDPDVCDPDDLANPPQACIDLGACAAG